MTSHDNQPPPADWQPQPGRHCGQNCIDPVCGVCGEWTGIPANVVLSDN